MIEFILAFGAGLLSFLSPCVLPLIPGYISYISGSTLNELLEKKNKARFKGIQCDLTDHHQIKNHLKVHYQIY